MFGLAVTFLIVALIAGILGFGLIAGVAVEFAKIVFFVVLLLCCTEWVLRRRWGVV